MPQLPVVGLDDRDSFPEMYTTSAVSTLTVCREAGAFLDLSFCFHLCKCSKCQDNVPKKALCRTGQLGCVAKLCLKSVFGSPRCWSSRLWNFGSAQEFVEAQSESGLPIEKWWLRLSSDGDARQSISQKYWDGLATESFDTKLMKPPPETLRLWVRRRQGNQQD